MRTFPTFPRFFSGLKSHSGGRELLPLGLINAANAIMTPRPFLPLVCLMNLHVDCECRKLHGGREIKKKSSNKRIVYGLLQGKSFFSARGAEVDLIHLRDAFHRRALTHSRRRTESRRLRRCPMPELHQMDYRRASDAPAGSGGIHSSVDCQA